MGAGSTTVLQGWIDRMNAADPAARDALIQHSYERLQRLTRHMFQDFARLQRRQEADDVLQNALLRLLRALEVVPVGSVREFFSLAAMQIRRELLDMARHHFGPEGSCARQADPQPASDSGTDAPRPEARADSTFEPGRLEPWSALHRQVESLPPAEREVFGLLWYHGLTQSEAAAVLKVSQATVKRWWLAARLHLQERLRGEVPTA
jgi:RNA polymerase sigma-70 factor (ECF subfamily)